MNCLVWYPRICVSQISHYGVWRVMGVLAVSRAIGDLPLKPYGRCLFLSCRCEALCVRPCGLCFCLSLLLQYHIHHRPLACLLPVSFGLAASPVQYRCVSAIQSRCNYHSISLYLPFNLAVSAIRPRCICHSISLYLPFDLVVSISLNL